METDCRVEDSWPGRKKAGGINQKSIPANPDGMGDGYPSPTDPKNQAIRSIRSHKSLIPEPPETPIIPETPENPDIPENPEAPGTPTAPPNANRPETKKRGLQVLLAVPSIKAGGDLLFHKQVQYHRRCGA